MVKNENCNSFYTTRRIGATTYKVRVAFDDSGTETMEDKILRLIRNEVVTNDGTCDTMDLPQMSQQSERSAS
ncbi:MAG: transposon-encoded TnpW family protein [Clostridiales bacterium]|nr:transposon-encoded TnpW family protein [Clostridiales bacterium]